MPACTPDRGSNTPTFRPAACDLAMLQGATLATMPAPRPLATLRRVTPLDLACVLRLIRFLLLLSKATFCCPREYMSFALVASFLPDIVPPQALTGGRGICLGCRRSCGSSVRSRGGP